MQQYKFLKQKFQLSKLPYVRLPNQKRTTLQNGEVLLMAAWVMTVLNIFGLFYPLTVLIFGLFLPIYCSYLDIYTSKYYFQVLAFQLWFRMWSPSLSFIDSWLFICLWHPNICLSEKIVKIFQSTFLQKQNSLKQRISHKIDKLID